MASTTVQYIVLRTDLQKDKGWSLASVVAQACHASTAVLHLYKDDEHTIQYLNDLDNKQNVVLEVPNESTLKKIAEKITEMSIAHKLWIDQTENIPTCIAIKPYPKDTLNIFLRDMKVLQRQG